MKTISVQQNEARAVSKYIRMSPSKIRRVLQQIQGKSYSDALLVLEFLPYSSCEPIIKVLRSAAANAKHNKGFDEKNLIVKSAFANQGPTMKRFRPRAQGRAYRIQKATSHITIIVAS
jgi:large subunit ribosomal protein L22|tara:strand:- start:773 stop:1126 length:354 start_codon:yes stop_codon:yes gene_type:complete